MDASRILLSSHFYAYAKGRTPWGLPNYFWSEAPHLLVLFDKLLCDEEAFKAEKLAHDELGWVGSGLFVRLKREGVLETERMEQIVLKAQEPPPVLGVPARDSYYAIRVQQHLQERMNAPLLVFDWARSVTDTAQTMAPSISPAAGYWGKMPDRASRKLRYISTVIANQCSITPPLTSLTGAAARGYVAVRQLEDPDWKQLENLEISQADYIDKLRAFLNYYKQIDRQLKAISESNFEKFIRFRDDTEKQRREIRPLIQEAFDQKKDVKEYAQNVQAELAKAIPYVFSELRVKNTAAKVAIGAAIVAAPLVAGFYGYAMSPKVTEGLDAVMVGPLYESLKEEARLAKKRQESANPLRVLIKKAKRHQLA